MAHVYTPGVQGELAPRSIRLAHTKVMQLVQHTYCATCVYSNLMY